MRKNRHPAILDILMRDGLLRRLLARIAPESRKAFEPISLGTQCETKYQISRVRYERESRIDDQPFSASLLQSELQRRRFVSHIFDAQTTPFVSLCDWLEADFKGVFEHDDFVVDEGEPINRRYHTRHPHEFPARSGTLTIADIHAAYPVARSRFEYLAQRFRRHMETLEPTLYVVREIRPWADVQRLRTLLHHGNSSRQFHILMVDWDGTTPDWAPGRDASMAWLPHDTGKPEGRTWEGNDQAWNRALAPFRFTTTRRAPLSSERPPRLEDR